MTGTEFVAQLMAENEELLAKIDAPAESRLARSERSQDAITVMAARCSRVSRRPLRLRKQRAAQLVAYSKPEIAFALRLGNRPALQ
jgi:hypothetical protein